MAEAWTIRCDERGCRASVVYEHEEPSEALLGVIAKAEQLGWFVASQHDHGDRIGVAVVERDHCAKHRSK